MRRRKSQLPRATPTRVQLLAGFSVMVAMLVAALTVGIERFLSNGIRDAALSGAEQTGQIIAELEVGPEEYAGRRLTAVAPKDLDAVVANSSTLRAARLWNPAAELMYSSYVRADEQAPDKDSLRAAFAGDTVSRVSNGRSSQPLLTIFVPITLPGDRRPRSVLELHLPYAPVQATIASRNGRMTLALVLGALLFSLVLLPTILRASAGLADHYALRQAGLQARIRRALRDGELVLYYQPKLDLSTDRIAGVEALLRWHLADGSIVAPADYLPKLETTPVMKELTAHIFELAARQSAAWAREGVELDIAVNIAAGNLLEADLPDRLARLAARHQRSPEQFTLELTEGAMSERLDRDMSTLAGLRASGFKLSIDDFGTGESSLSRVDTIEFQELKIDRSFVRAIDERNDSMLIARIIGLAHDLGARAVAEGVESAAAANRLAELGCDVIQGFYLARPMPAHEVADWLSDRSASLAPVLNTV